MDFLKILRVSKNTYAGMVLGVFCITMLLSIAVGVFDDFNILGRCLLPLIVTYVGMVCLGIWRDQDRWGE